MPRSVASIGVFSTRDQALLTAEKLYEIVGRRGVVRVLFAGTRGSVVKVSVLPDGRGTFVVAIGGAVLGILALALTMLLGAGLIMGLLALTWGIAIGAMFAVWLTGSTEVARTLRSFDAKRCYDMLAGTQRAVVVAVSSANHEHAVHSCIEGNHGTSLDALNPWLTAATSTPSSAISETQPGTVRHP